MDVPPRCQSETDSLEPGFNRAKKLLKQKNAKKVFLALDADPLLASEIDALCRNAGVSPDRAHTKSELGTLCGLEVGCAVCVQPAE